jgi:hypothetical protein
MTEEHVLPGTQSLGFALIIGCSLLTFMIVPLATDLDDYPGL